MSDFPKAIEFSRSVISTMDMESAGYPITQISGIFNTATLAWPAANLAMYIPFTIANTITAVKMFWINGATVGTDSIDVGIYDSEQNRLVSIGPTLTSGANAVQIVDITDTTLQPGTYYFGFSMSGTTDRFIFASSGAPIPRLAGVYEQTSAGTLPNPATFAVNSRNIVPFVALTTNTTI